MNEWPVVLVLLKTAGVGDHLVMGQLGENPEWVGEGLGVLPIFLSPALHKSKEQVYTTG